MTRYGLILFSSIGFMAIVDVLPDAKAVTPSDPDFSRQWGLYNTGQRFDSDLEAGRSGADINIIPAWKIHRGTPSVTIAVIGRGIDPHPEFADRLLEGRSFAADPYDTLDFCPHDTHLAGILAAGRDNGLGIAGINDRALLLPVRTLDGCGGSASTTASGIVWAVDQGAQVILAAVQFAEPNTDLALAIDYAVTHDALVVAPAGSEGALQVAFPGAYDGCVAVSATDARDGWSSVSNQGPEVEISAPGVAIWSTWVNGTYAYQSTGRDTMSAAAFVAGVASLVRSLNPDLPAGKVRQLLVGTSDDLGKPGRDVRFGWGRLNAGRAMKAVPIPPLRIERVMTPPRLIPPDWGSTLPIRIVSADQSLASVFLFYRTGGAPFMSVPLTPLGNDLFLIEFPTLPCNTPVDYFVGADDQAGVFVTDPPDALQHPYAARVTYEDIVFEDHFESDRGWRVEGGDNRSGRWTRVDPVGTSAQPEYDRTPDAGRSCFVTGQHFGGNAGSNDVDGGPLQLTSPVIPLPSRDALISYARWFFWGGNGQEDFLTVELSLNGGVNWTTVETVASTGAWVVHTLALSDFPALSGDALQLRFSVSDVPNDSLTEAAVDDVMVTASRCAVTMGDVDGNGVIDPADYGRLIACWTPPSIRPVTGACQSFDFDRDFRVDLADFQDFQHSFGR